MTASGEATPVHHFAAAAATFPYAAAAAVETLVSELGVPALGIVMGNLASESDAPGPETAAGNFVADPGVPGVETAGETAAVSVTGMTAPGFGALPAAAGTAAFALGALAGGTLAFALGVPAAGTEPFELDAPPGETEAFALDAPPGGTDAFALDAPGGTATSGLETPGTAVAVPWVGEPGDVLVAGTAVGGIAPAGAGDGVTVPAGTVVFEPSLVGPAVVVPVAVAAVLSVAAGFVTEMVSAGFAAAGPAVAEFVFPAAESAAVPAIGG